MKLTLLSLRGALTAGLLVGFGAAPAVAGTCPAGKAGIDVMKPSDAPASGVTDTVLSSIDLAKEPVAVDGRMLRLRRLTVAPGGVVPYHSHGNRPAIIHVVSGTITEYASTGAVPFVHKAGESVAELNKTSHWWRNTGKVPVVLLASDFFPVDGDPKAM